MAAFLRFLRERLSFLRRDPGAGQGRRALDTTRGRLTFAVACFMVAYAVIGARLASLAMVPDAEVVYRVTAQDSVSAARPDLLDRNGDMLATDITMASLYAEPRRIIDVDEASELLTAVLPNLNARELREKLSSDKGFVWLQREITPRQQAELFDLGLPGIGFLQESKRVYPSGRIASYVLGHVNVDNRGIAGMEKYIDTTGLGDLHMAGFARDASLDPVTLSIDGRVQYALRDELVTAMDKFSAKAAMGIVLDVNTGEVVAMHSLPDYDPNNPVEALQPDRLNRVATGVFEMGSIFKTFTTAMVLDSGLAGLNTMFDASRPMRIGRFTISDYKGKNRALSVPEVFIYSSNIGTVREAFAVGVEGHKDFLRRLGLLDRQRTELPESAAPLVPGQWGDISTATISYGHGLSVTPLQMAAAGAAMVNGGWLVTPTMLPRTADEARADATQVISAQTSEQMRFIMRLNSVKGTATKAEVAGYRVGGKTGTAEKVVDGRYAEKKLMTTFLGVFPMDDPQYLTLIALDEPEGLEETYGYATAGWNAAPTTARLIQRIAPMLGVSPRFDIDESQAIASYQSY